MTNLRILTIQLIFCVVKKWLMRFQPLGQDCGARLRFLRSGLELSKNGASFAFHSIVKWRHQTTVIVRARRMHCCKKF